MGERDRFLKRDLLVPLSYEEKERNAKLMAMKYKEAEAVDAQRKQVAKEYSTKLAGITNDLSRLAEATSKGAELRQVECVERWHAGIVEIVRLDTHEVVEVRAETAADQQSIPGIDDEYVETKESGRVLKFVPPADLVTPGQPEERTDAPGWIASQERLVPSEAADSAGEAGAEDVGDVVDSSAGDEVFIGGGVEGEDAEAMAVHTGGAPGPAWGGGEPSEDAGDDISAGYTNPPDDEDDDAPPIGAAGDVIQPFTAGATADDGVELDAAYEARKEAEAEAKAREAEAAKAAEAKSTKAKDKAPSKSTKKNKK